MSKRLFPLIIVFVLHHLVMGDDALDIKTTENTCFMENCKTAFYVLKKDDPQCGSDGNPYHNMEALLCANECAKNVGSEVTAVSQGPCPGKPLAREYWSVGYPWENF